MHSDAAGSSSQSQRPPQPRQTAARLIEESSLSSELKEIVRDFVRKTRWRGRKANDLASGMIHQLTREVEQGHTESELLSEWKGCRPLREFRRWKDPSLLGLHQLPTSIRRYIIHVVRRTRLWAAEQRAIASQLLNQFETKLAAGCSIEQALSDSGSVAAVAQKLRRSTVRTRPLSWHLFNRSSQLMEILFVLFFVWWLWLLVRFQFSKPRVTHDFIGQWDQQSLRIPESDRAWPRYADALEQLSFWKSFELPLDDGEEPGREWRSLVVPMEQADLPIALRSARRTPIRRSYQKGKLYRMDWAHFDLAVRASSDGPNWPALLRLLEKNRTSLESTIEASLRPHLGFVYRDPMNRRWFQGSENEYRRFCSSTESPLIDVANPHVFAIRVLQNLLLIEIERARIQGDSERVVQTVTAGLRLALQFELSDGMSSSSQVGIRHACRCWNAVRKILHDQPEFLSDEQLKVVSAVVEDFRKSESGRANPTIGWRECTEDLLQRIYTDDGHGDGQLTADGWKLLLDLNNEEGEVQKSWEVVDSHRESGSLRFSVEGALWSGLTISRQQLKQILNEYRELELVENRQPLWELKLDTITPASRYLQLSVASWSHQLQRKPLVVLQPVITMSDRKAEDRVFRECALMQLDATIIACALELYHRQNQGWPEKLEELTPQLISSVPLDRFDGKPMKYLVADGKPILYSVGRNHVDNEGRWPTQFKGGHELRVDDWRLWPLWEGDL